MIIVVAQNWRAFVQYCATKDIDPGDRLRAIPLITGPDVYRLSRTNCRSARVVKVGRIENELARMFEAHLGQNGLEVQL